MNQIFCLFKEIVFLCVPLKITSNDLKLLNWVCFSLISVKILGFFPPISPINPNLTDGLIKSLLRNPLSDWQVDCSPNYFAANKKGYNLKPVCVPFEFFLLNKISNSDLWTSTSSWKVFWDVRSSIFASCLFVCQAESEPRGTAWGEKSRGVNPVAGKFQAKTGVRCNSLEDVIRMTCLVLFSCLIYSSNDLPLQRVDNSTYRPVPC